MRIIGKPVEDGPPPEVTITLASIIAPKLKAGVPEEPFAWESREFLRELCIGKRVTFRVLQVVPTINRTFGEVLLITDAPEPINLQLATVEAGWTSVKEAGGSGSVTSESLQRLREAETRAKGSKLGIHCGIPPSTPSFNTSPTQSDLESIVGSFKRKNTPAIIEYVRDGASLRVLLLECNAIVSFSITGLYCPRFNSGGAVSAGAAPSPEAYAEQARLFTQMRLLQRKLQVHIEGIESNGSGILGTVLHPKGNIAVDIIRAGLGRVSERSLGLLPLEIVSTMRSAENEAKAARRCIWHDFSPSTPSIEQRSYEATCVEVVSGDTVVVVEGDLDSGAERRLTIAGIRVPRLGAQGGKGSDAEPWAIECKEMLISSLVGKQVQVTEEYSKPASATGPERVFASISVDLPVGRGKYVKTNIAEHLLSCGLCQCVRYKAGSDGERVQGYDLLLIAEAKAEESGKGLHGTSQPPSASSHAVNDLSTDIKRAKQYFGLLHSSSKSSAYRGPATVAFVFSGSRMKIYLPYPENCYLQFSLSEVRCPIIGRSAKSGTSGEATRTSEPFAVEARLFTRRRLMQRTVEVELLDMDKNGVAFGRLFFTPDDGSKESVSLALALVQRGLAKVDKYASSKGGPTVELLLNAQADCKASGRNIWSLPEEEEPLRAQIDNLGSRPGQLVRARVCEIISGNRFYVHVMEDDSYPTAPLQQIEEMMVEFEAGVRPEPEDLPLKKGQTCVCRFRAEPGKWFRGRIMEIEGGEVDKSIRVHYIDYGNTDVVSSQDLVICSPGSFIFTKPALATECCLALVSVKPVEDSDGFGREAALYLSDLVWDRDVLLQVISTPDVGFPVPVALFNLPPDGGLSLDHLIDEDDGQSRSFNEEMIRQGLARISRTASRRLFGAEKVSLHNRLRDAQDEAMRKHVNMFRYGHPGDSDDDGF